MKKLITLMLALTILCTNCFATIFAHSGDVNDDNIISVLDVVKTRADIVGNAKLNQDEASAADVSNDGNVDVVDIMLMRLSIINKNGELYMIDSQLTDSDAATETDSQTETDVISDIDIDSDISTIVDTDSGTCNDGPDTDAIKEPYQRLLYYRNLLSAGTQQNVYDAIVEGITKCETSIKFEEISESQVMTIYNYVIYDHPEFYYLKSSYSYLINSMDKVIGILPNYYEEFNNLAKVNEGFTYIESEIDPIVKGALEKKTDYEKIMYVYDAIKARYRYDITPNSYNIYGALKYSGAVCEGYSETFAYILDKLEIPNILVGGQIINTKVPHRWNMLYLEGEWYNFDVTWDDNYNDETIEYSYFGITTADISKSRYIDSEAPIATSNKYDFYYRNNLIVNGCTYEELCGAGDISCKMSKNTVAFKFKNKADFDSFMNDPAIRSKLVRRYVGNVAFTYITKQYTDLNIIEITWYVS